MLFDANQVNGIYVCATEVRRKNLRTRSKGYATAYVTRQSYWLTRLYVPLRIASLGRSRETFCLLEIVQYYSGEWRHGVTAFSHRRHELAKNLKNLAKRK